MPKQVGAITLSYLLNVRGRIEIELTISKFTEDSFYLVCAAFFEQRLLDHLKFNSNGEDVLIKCLSTKWSALTINGPLARNVLSQCTHTKLDNNNFPWLKAKEITVAGHKVWALRMSYAGELGWELHMPSSACLDVYKTLMKHGKRHNIINYGSFAMNVMRNVMKFVDTTKNFLGKDKTLSDINNLPWLCVYLAIESNDTEDGNGGEAVLNEGRLVGSIVSIVYSHTVKKILAFAYVKPEASKPNTTLEVIIADQSRKAIVLSEAAYDPKNLKPREYLEEENL